jgi:hypothetical protein
MERPEFEITIRKDGKMTVKVKGVKGVKCGQLADMIKEIVGKEDDRQYTSDYYVQEGQVRINAQVKDQRPQG